MNTIGYNSLRKGKRVLLLLCGTLLPILSAQAQPLDSLVRRVLERHPSIVGTHLSIERTEATAQMAGAWEPPKVGVEFSMLPPANPNPTSRGETMFMVEQEIPLFGQNGKMANAIRLNGDVYREELSGTMRELRSRIEEEYYQLWLLDQRTELNAKNRALAEILYSDAETRYQINAGSQTDLYTIAIEIQRLDAELRSIRVERRTAQAEINTLLLQAPGDTVIVLDSLPSTPLPPLQELIEAIEANPDLKKMDAMARMNQAESEAAKSMLDPMLMLRGGVAVMPQGHPVRMAELGDMVEEFHSYGENTVDRLGLALGAVISIPLAPWSRSGPNAKAEAARLQGEEALSEKERMRQEMIAMLSREYGMAEGAQIWIEHYRDKQIPLLEQSLKALRADYISGRGSVSSLIETYRMLTMAQDEIAMRKTEYATALAQIKKLTGADI